MHEDEDESMPNSHTLYSICYRDGDDRVTQWFTTFNKAMRRLRQLQMQDHASVRTVEIPKAKIRLCAWLNTATNDVR